MKSKMKVISVILIISLLCTINIVAFAGESESCENFVEYEESVQPNYTETAEENIEEYSASTFDVDTASIPSIDSNDKILPIQYENNSYVNPSDYESISLVNGSMNFVYPVVNLTGKAGMDVNLTLKYNSYDALYDTENLIVSRQKYNDEGIALGWSFGVPRMRREGKNSTITLPDGQTVYNTADEDFFTNAYSEIIYVKDKRPVRDFYFRSIKGVQYADGHYLDLSDVPDVLEDSREYSIKYSDRYENTLTYTYDLKNRLKSITDTLGREITVEYNKRISGETGKNNILIKVDDSIVYTIEIEEKTKIDNSSYNFIFNYWILNSLTDASGDRINFSYKQTCQDRSIYFNGVKKYAYLLSEYLTNITYPTGGVSEYDYSYKTPTRAEKPFYYQVNVLNKTIFPIKLYCVLSNSITGSKGLKSYLYEYTPDIVNKSSPKNTIAYNREVVQKSDDGERTIYTLNQYGELSKVQEYIGNNKYILTEYYWKTIPGTKKLLHQLINKTTAVYHGSSICGDTVTTEKWDYDYESRGTHSYNNLIKHVDVYGNVTTFEYDIEYFLPTKEVTVSADGNFTVTKINELSADKKNIIKSTTITSDNIKTLSEYSYDSNGQVISTSYSETDKETMVTENQYDYSQTVFPLTVKIKNIETNDKEFKSYTYDKVTKYTYDNFDRIITESIYASDVPSQSMKTTYLYNENGSLKRTTAPNGDVTEYTYNLKNSNGSYNITENSTVITNKFKDGTVYVEKEVYDDFGFIIKKQKLNPENNFVDCAKYSYKNGHLYSFVDEHDLQTIYEYDKIGRIIKIVNPDGTNKTVFYDDRNMSMVTTNEEGFQNTVIYDKFGRTVKEIAANEAATSYEYDWMCNVSKIIDPLGGETVNEYDGLGRLISVISPESEITKYEYDSFGNIIKMVTNGGSNLKYKYDILNNLIEQTDALGKTEKFAYDVFGRLLCSVDKSGTISTIDYVDKTVLPSRERKVNGGAVEETQLSYNAFGNVVQKQDIDGKNIIMYEYTYDQKLLSVNENGKKLEYTYGADDFLETSKDYFGNLTEYTYDNGGRVINIHSNAGNISYTYTPCGYVQNEIRDGIVTEYIYTNVGLLQRLTNKENGGASINSYSYTYDNAGNRISQTEENGSCINTENYSYDSVGRLISVTSDDECTLYTYDDNGNRATQTVTKDGVQNLIIDYNYDLQNHLVKQVSQSPSETITKKYVYDNNDNLYSETTNIIKNASDNKEYTIAQTGEADLYPMFKLYKYNLSNQLVGYEDDNGIKASYSYNSDGMRSTKTVNGETIRYYYNGMYVVNEEQNGELTATNILGADGIIGRDAQNEIGWFVNNGHRDVIQARKADGTILGSYDYDAWGNATFSDSEWDNPIRYAGEYLDEESGLIYLRARYYDPVTSRMLSEDPARQGTNWYIYCNNNPIKYIDPSGLTYVIGWSYGSHDVMEYEQYRSDNGYSVTVDGDISDWDDATWSDFTQRSSFARAAYTKKQELLDMGVAESDIDVQRIDSEADLQATWNMWAGYGLIEGLDFYSHGYSEGAEVYGGSGDFWDSAQKLNFGESLRQIDGKGVILQPYAVFYGCNTANGSFAQNFSNTQAVTVYAQTDYASFSHTRTNRTWITTHATSKNVYLLSFESWGGLRNNDGLGKVFRPNN